MEIWDIVAPHRLLINLGLRKSSQQLKDEIDSYQIEYNEKLKAVKNELNEVEQGINQKLEEAKNAFNQELLQEHQDLSSLRDNVLEYIKIFQTNRSNKLLIRIYKSRKRILRENISFLYKQIQLINEETGLLRERIRQLNSFADVSDILSLASQSGYNFGLAGDARSLLLIINERLRDNTESDQYEKYALTKLKGIVQERSNYMATIDYLNWVIASKREFCKQIAAERNAKKAELQATDIELAELYEKNNHFNNETNELSEQIRLYWAKHIAFLNADIRFQLHKRQELYNQKNEKISRHKAVLAELKHMASIHSSDEYKWDRLQDEQRSLSSDIDTIKSEIALIDADLSETRSEIKYWYDLRSFVYDLCNKYDSHLKSDKSNDMSDEERVIRTRLSELSCIRKAGAIEAESLCEKKKAEIKAQYDKKAELTDSMIESYEAELQKNSSELKRLQAKLAESTQILELTKKQDTRNLISKFFSDTPETQRARTVVQMDSEKISTKNAEINKLTIQIKELKARRDEETTEYIQSCNKCAPIYLRPTKEERVEEQRLRFRLDEIIEKNKEGSDESKN